MCNGPYIKPEVIILETSCFTQEKGDYSTEKLLTSNLRPSQQTHKFGRSDTKVQIDG
jgi:hypothetical protein